MMINSAGTALVDDNIIGKRPVNWKLEIRLTIFSVAHRFCDYWRRIYLGQREVDNSGRDDLHLSVNKFQAGTTVIRQIEQISETQLHRMF